MATATVEVHGHCERRFAAVREAFALNFEEHPEIGAAVAVMWRGRPVVDLWAGYADGERTRPWERDTIVNVWSTTKGLAALAAHMLSDRGLLDFDAPVARYWPEFATEGKEAMPLRYLLTHQAGLPNWEPGLPEGGILDWELATSALAAQAPAWPPGARQGYHALTFGHLVGEVVRRVARRSVGRFLLEEVARPLGVDVLVGFGADEDHRVAQTVRAPGGVDRRLGRPGALASLPDVNSREWRAVEVPAANCHTNARALARIYGALACCGTLDEVRLLSPSAVELAALEQVNGKDQTLGVPTHRTLGFMLPFREFEDVRPASSFGHAGAGGSQGFADPNAELGFGYVMNQMLTFPDRPPSGGTDPRGQRLISAVYASIA